MEALCDLLSERRINAACVSASRKPATVEEEEEEKEEAEEQEQVRRRLMAEVRADLGASRWRRAEAARLAANSALMNGGSWSCSSSGLPGPTKPSEGD